MKNVEVIIDQVSANPEISLAILGIVYDIIVSVIPTKKNISLLDNLVKIIRLIITNKRKKSTYDFTEQDESKNIIAVKRNRHVIKIILLLMISGSACAQTNGRFKSLALYNADSTTVKNEVATLVTLYDSVFAMYLNEQASPAKLRCYSPSQGWYDCPVTSGGGGAGITNVAGINDIPVTLDASGNLGNAPNTIIRAVNNELRQSITDGTDSSYVNLRLEDGIGSYGAIMGSTLSPFNSYVVSLGGQVSILGSDGTTTAEHYVGNGSNTLLTSDASNNNTLYVTPSLTSNQVNVVGGSSVFDVGNGSIIGTTTITANGQNVVFDQSATSLNITATNPSSGANGTNVISTNDGYINVSDGSGIGSSMQANYSGVNLNTVNGSDAAILEISPTTGLTVTTNGDVGLQVNNTVSALSGLGGSANIVIDNSTGDISLNTSGIIDIGSAVYTTAVTTDTSQYVLTTRFSDGLVGRRKVTGGGGGITNSSGISEIPTTADGSGNLATSGIIAATNGNMLLGLFSDASPTRSITSNGSSANVDLNLRAKGQGTVQLVTESNNLAYFYISNAIARLQHDSGTDNDQVFQIYGKDITSGTNNAGDIVIQGGSTTQSGNGGDITLTPGSSTSGTTGYLYITNIPTSCSGVPTGAIANVSGVLTVCP